MELEHQRGLYHPVSAQESSLSEDAAEERQQVHRSGDDVADVDDATARLPLELSIGEEDHEDVDQTRFLKVVPSHDGASIPSILVSLLVVLTLTGVATLLFRLLGRMFVALPFCWHAALCALSLRLELSQTSTRWRQRAAISICKLLDIILLGMIYPKLWNLMVDVFFTDVDGTTIIEWEDERQAIQVLAFMGRLLACMRLVLGTIDCMCLVIDFCVLPPWLATSCYRVNSACVLDRTRQLSLANVANVVVSLSMLGLVWSFYSAAVHFYPWPPPSTYSQDCDLMDETECWLPFPSMEFMKPDPSTSTGWRVNLQGQSLPPLKGRVQMDPSFLNELDGFSTMGSILFYMQGLREAHEAGVGQLQGPASIAASVTQKSITLLLDVNRSMLVAHSAEIDYLDPARPLVMVFPAQPLRHATHYALAVVNATDELGNLLAASSHLTTLLSAPLGGSQRLIDRANRYKEYVMPALESAAPWISLNDNPETLQMIFDFVTVSEESQLGPVRAVRDATMAYVSSPAWGDWRNHVHAVQTVDYDCSDSLIARTVHAAIDVPWYLEAYGRGHRGAVLDADAVSQRMPTTIGTAKFVLHIPCSLRLAAASSGDDHAKPLRAVVEFGHGLFFSRQEASERFLQEMAHAEGFALLAMDWRGMSVYDLLVVGKVLLSRPRLFQATRDNLIQGYANKYAMLHFSQNGMLSMDWFRFEFPSTGVSNVVPTLNNEPPVSAFYGISQGGILGAGYAALSGSTGLLDRAVLGVPGTPFALVMTRSLDFAGYDMLLLLNFYDNRHVRELLALVQMAWDSVEGSGVLAPPIREPIPKMLLQAGLGDAVVPSIAAEALARGLNASVLSNNPRSIYNVPVADAVSGGSDGPSAVLTEILYEKEYASLPADDTRMEGNSVHVCVRRDVAMIHQVSEFIKSGDYIDVCANDGCRREHSC